MLLEQTELAPAIEDVLAFEIHASADVPDQAIVLLPEFMFEAADDVASEVLNATGAHGATLRIALAPWQMWVETAPDSLWQVASPHSEPMPAGVQPTGNGVRLQADFANKRVAIAPEATDQHGFAVKGAVAATLSKRGAIGLVGGGGAGQRDVVVNAGLRVRDDQRLLVSLGSLQQEVDLPFENGRERRRLRQASGGAAYSVTLGGPLQPRLDAQAYMADSGSLDLGPQQFFSNRDGQAQLFRLDRRVAGARLTGAQTRTALRLGDDATLTVTFGAERLRYAFATGNDVTYSATRGVDWMQQLDHGYSLQAYARTQAAMHVTGLRTERRFGSQGHRLGVELTRIDGRNGLMDDTQLRFTQTFSFGGRGSASPQASDAATREMNAEMSALLDDVSQRPVFLPLVPLAKVDPTIRAERLVAVDHAGMVPGTTISSVDGTVRVPANVVEISAVSKNGAAFSNTGQFSISGTDLLIHPIRMVAPVSGIDQYVVVMKNVEGRSTAATVDVARGSVHILRVTLTKEDADTTPDAFAFASVGNVAVNGLGQSEEVVITGLNGPAPITIAGGEYSIEGGPFTSEPGTITNSQRVVVRVRAPATHGSTATAVVTIGGVSAEFTVTTPAPVTTPEPFAFAAGSGTAPGAHAESEAVSIGGINVPVEVSIAGGEYSINGGPYTDAAGSISSGDVVRVRVRAASTPSTTTSATLTIGGVSVTYSTTTAAAAAASDTTPDSFGFTGQNGVARNTLITSAAASVSGINGPAAISIVGGEYRIEGGEFTSNPGTVSNGQRVVVRLTSSAAAATTSKATVTIGGVIGEFEVTTGPDSSVVDTTPDAFSFVAATDVAVNTEVTSSGASLSGLGAPASISIVGGEYSIDGGPFTSTPGTVANGQTVRVRLTSPATPGSSSSATLTIGGVSTVFTVSTVGADTAPDAFSFPSQSDVALSTMVTSAPVVVSGINTSAAISITGGEYSIDGGAFTSTPGTVTNGQSVRVRLTSSLNVGTAVTAAVTIGGVNGAFSASTVGADTTPDAFSFPSQSDVAMSTVVTSAPIVISGINTSAAISVTGGEYSIDGLAFTSTPGTVTNGQSVRLRLTSPSSAGSAVSATVTIGGVNGVFSVSTVGADITPDAFSFSAQSNVLRNTLVTSNTITVSGINTASAISVTGGEYSINGGGYTSSAGTVANGESVTVRLTSSGSYATATIATLTIGGVPANFSVTTENAPADTTPDAFSFSAQSSVPRNTLVVSNVVTVSGINTASAISVTGAEYSTNGGGYTSSAGTVANGESVTVRLTSSGSYGTTTSATLTIGGVSANFSVTTENAPADITPDAFSFSAQSNVLRNTLVTSNTITVSGINTASAISVTGGEYSINGGGYTSSAGTVADGESVTVRLTSSGSYGTTTSATLTIGGVSANFSVTTENAPADTTPDAFSFSAQSNVLRNTLVTSNVVTVSGINTPAAISVTGGEYSINGSGYTSSAGMVANGDSVTVRLTSSGSYGTTTNATVTIGGVSAGFSVTTENAPADTTPDAFSFSAQTAVAISTQVASNSITVSGINTAAAISVTGGQYSINGAAYTSSAGTVSNGQSVTVRLTSSSSYLTTTTATLTIGGVSAGFSVTTQSLDTTPDPFSFATKTNVNPNTTQSSETVTITGITPGTPVSVVNGQYKLNNDNWTNVPGTITNSDTIQVRHTSAMGSLASNTTTLTIGPVSATFTTITKP